MHADSIILTVPARGEYARTVRMTAAELGSRLGMSYDEVEDVRMAAEEAFVYACQCAAEAAEVTFRFAVGDDVIRISVGPLPGCCTDAGSAASEGYAEFILRSVCDEFSVEHSAGSCMLTLGCRMAAPAGAPGA